MESRHSTKQKVSHHGGSAMVVLAWGFISLALLSSIVFLPAKVPRIASPMAPSAGPASVWDHGAVLQQSPQGSEKETGDNAFVTLPPSMQQKLSMPPLSHARQRDRTMDEQTCRKEFPLLYPQLEELVSWWKRKGGLKMQTIDALERRATAHWGHVRLIIHDGNVYIRSFKEGQETRNSAVVHIIEQAMNSWPASFDDKDHRAGLFSNSNAGAGPLPTIDLLLSPGDRDGFPSEGGWLVTKRTDDHSHKGTWLIPDFGFAGWPEAGAGSYEDFVELASNVEARFPWTKKFNRLFWRGFANQYPVRKDLMHRTSVKEDASRESWSDVRETTFHNDKGDFVPIVAPHDHCQHKYLIHTEGNSYSGRSKYLFSCESVVVAHPLEWTQHFHPALNNVSSSGQQNFVQLPGPYFQGIDVVAKELQDLDGGAGTKNAGMQRTYLGHNSPREIARNAARTLRDRYLTPAATACYTRAALKHYASALDLQSWGSNGPEVLPGQGITPGTTKGGPLDAEHKGDIEVGVWRLLGSPNWPPAST